MSTTSTVIAICAAALLSSTAGCKDSQVKGAAGDVQDAREDVRDAKQEVAEERQEVKEEKIEFSTELKKRVAEAEERYKKLDLRSSSVATPSTDLTAIKQHVDAEIEDVRKATPTTVERELEELDAAMDKYEDALDKYDNDAM